MNLNTFTSLRRAGLFASLALALTAGPARSADKNVDAFPVFESYIKITGRAPSVTGNDSSYARRFQTPQNGAYGIEALHIARDTGQDTTMEFDGRALTGSEDYLGKLRFTKNEVGSVEAGYKRFRTFYDGIGGFFPLNNSFRQLNPAELHTDRAKFWAVAKMERPNQPRFEFSYVNDLRDGRKDTTIWGDSDFTGITVWSNTNQSQNPLYLYSPARKVIPSYIDLNERQQTLLGLVKHAVGNTEFELEVAYNRTNSLDTRWVNRFPGELKPFPTIPTNPVTIIAPALASNPNFGFDTQGTKSKVWTYTGKFETKVSDKLTVFGGLSYQSAKADIYGDREITLSVNTAVGLVSAVGGFGTFSTRPPYSYKTVAGNTKQNILTGNLGATFKPQKDLLLTFAFKGENLDMDGVNLVNYINNLIVQSTGSVTPVFVPAPNISVRNEKSWVPEINIRYTGIKDLALYGAFDYRYSPGEQNATSTGVTPSAPFNGTVLPSVGTMFDNIKLKHGHYKVGANWTVNPVLSLRGEVFYKNHTNKYPDKEVPTDGFSFDSQFYGTKLTAIVKPMPTITFTTRYVGQHGKMHTIVDSGTNMQSNDTKNYSFGETIDWNPTNQVYLQANLNVVFNTIKTAYPVAGGLGNEVLRNADNNYTSGSFVTGMVVDKETNASLQYTFYRANNFKAPTNATQFYGAGVKEYTVAAVVKHKFTNRLVGEAKVGYFDSKNDTTGGNTNFKGPMVYVSLTHAL